jgi:hypothetical protein
MQHAVTASHVQVCAIAINFRVTEHSRKRMLSARWRAHALQAGRLLVCKQRGAGQLAPVQQALQLGRHLRLHLF